MITRRHALMGTAGLATTALARRAAAVDMPAPGKRA